MTLLAKFLVTPAVLLFSAAFVPGVEVSGVYVALIVALLLAVVNVTIKPVLILLTLPITIITLGLFIFIINTLMLLFVASFVEGFSFDGFLPALLVALLIAFAHWVANRVLD